MFTKRFASLGYPTYLIYPLVVAKILGLVTIWTNKAKTLKEWAYAGFFFNFALAFLAELHASDGEYMSSPLALLLLMISYFSRQNDSVTISTLSGSISVPNRQQP
jgi:hypothetical protein